MNNLLIEEERGEFPDIHELFLYYNDLCFGGNLGSVIVRWSSRMKLCAGTCTYEIGGRCVISLSEPLLKYRSVKELKETLLHELIHAYLFVTNNCKDRSAHGPEFIFHMNRINMKTGLNITIYHSFINEVNFYRTNIWRCNGPCRLEAPYYGFVKRSINRAPGPNDSWWNLHLSKCGGKFTKISDSDKTRNSTVFNKQISNSYASKEETQKTNIDLSSDSDVEIIQIVEISD